MVKILTMARRTLLTLILLLAVIAGGCGSGGSSGTPAASAPQGAIPASSLICGDSPTPTNKATVSWTKPATNADGSAIANLAGYIVYFGNSSRAYPNAIVVSNPDTLNCLVSSLPAGTNYFAVTAFNSSGIESYYSEEVMITF